jgi:hypothetical protein
VGERFETSPEAGLRDQLSGAARGSWRNGRCGLSVGPERQRHQKRSAEWQDEANGQLHA